MKFEKFIESKYPGLNYLAISTEQYSPGMILNNDDRIVDSLQRIFKDQAPAAWTTKVATASINGETIQGERDLSLGSSLLGVFSLKAGVTSHYSIQFEFGAATSLVFDNDKGGIFENEARDLICKLKHSDHGRWKDILHEFVVIESLFVKSFKGKFKKDGNAAADVKDLENDISINADFSWNAGGEIEIRNNKTPFGVRGFIVKRFM